jgi:hypothetical protein
MIALLIKLATSAAIVLFCGAVLAFACISSWMLFDIICTILSEIKERWDKE